MGLLIKELTPNGIVLLYSIQKRLRLMDLQIIELIPIAILESRIFLLKCQRKFIIKRGFMLYFFCKIYSSDNSCIAFTKKY